MKNNKDFFKNEKKIGLGKGITIYIEKNELGIILLKMEIEKDDNFNANIMPLIQSNIISSWFVYNFTLSDILKINNEVVSIKKKVIRCFIEKEILKSI